MSNKSDTHDDIAPSTVLMTDEASEAPKKPRRARKKKTDETVIASAVTNDVPQEITETEKPKRTRKKSTVSTAEDLEPNKQARQQASSSGKSRKSRSFTPKEALLEFVELESGMLVLREMGTDEALVTIDFADKVKELIGAEYIQGIGQHMISAAIASVMERQMRQYHAYVYDEKPKRFS